MCFVRVPCKIAVKDEKKRRFLWELMKNDMTAGSPGKLIITFAIPMMLGNIFQQFYTMADTMIVGQVVGVEALAAVWGRRLAGMAGVGDHDRYHTGVFLFLYLSIMEQGKRKI